MPSEKNIFTLDVLNKGFAQAVSDSFCGCVGFEEVEIPISTDADVALWACNKAISIEGNPTVFYQKSLALAGDVVAQIQISVDAGPVETWDKDVPEIAAYTYTSPSPVSANDALFLALQDFCSNAIPVDWDYTTTNVREDSNGGVWLVLGSGRNTFELVITDLLGSLWGGELRVKALSGAGIGDYFSHSTFLPLQSFGAFDIATRLIGPYCPSTPRSVVASKVFNDGCCCNDVSIEGVEPPVYLARFAGDTGSGTGTPITAANELPTLDGKYPMAFALTKDGGAIPFDGSLNLEIRVGGSVPGSAQMVAIVSLVSGTSLLSALVSETAADIERPDGSFALGATMSANILPYLSGNISPSTSQMFTLDKLKVHELSMLRLYADNYGDFNFSVRIIDAATSVPLSPFSSVVVEPQAEIDCYELAASAEIDKTIGVLALTIRPNSTTNRVIGCASIVNGVYTFKATPSTSGSPAIPVSGTGSTSINSTWEVYYPHGYHCVIVPAFSNTVAGIYSIFHPRQRGNLILPSQSALTSFFMDEQDTDVDTFLSFFNSTSSGYTGDIDLSGLRRINGQVQWQNNTSATGRLILGPLEAGSFISLIRFSNTNIVQIINLSDWAPALVTTSVVDIRFDGCNLPPSEIDNILNALAAEPHVGGYSRTLNVQNQDGGTSRTSASDAAYLTLLANSWTILPAMP